MQSSLFVTGFWKICHVHTRIEKSILFTNTIKRGYITSHNASRGTISIKRISWKSIHHLHTTWNTWNGILLYYSKSWTASVNLYHMVKNFGSKKVWLKGCCKGLTKKLWQTLTCIANPQSSFKVKRNQICNSKHQWT